MSRLWHTGRYVNVLRVIMGAFNWWTESLGCRCGGHRVRLGMLSVMVIGCISVLLGMSCGLDDFVRHAQQVGTKRRLHPNRLLNADSQQLLSWCKRRRTSHRMTKFCFWRYYNQKLRLICGFNDSLMIYSLEAHFWRKPFLHSEISSLCRKGFYAVNKFWPKFSLYIS